MRRHSLLLYNSYDALRFVEAHRRAAVRAAPLCLSTEMHLWFMGFPWPLDEPGVDAVVTYLAESTSIGKSGQYLNILHEKGRIHLLGRDDAVPAQAGLGVMLTSKPSEGSRNQLKALLELDRPLAFVLGLGPRGLPKRFRSLPQHCDLTEQEYPMETATAMGFLAGRVREVQLS